MNSTALKSVLPWILVVIAFMIGFHLSSQRDPLTENTTLKQQKIYAENKLDDKDTSVRQKLLDDFEIAFLKQYTPLIGCEALDDHVKTSECSQHIEQAKNDFKQQFIKNRGLPKNTFEELKVSFAD